MREFVIVNFTFFFKAEENLFDKNVFVKYSMFWAVWLDSNQELVMNILQSTLFYKFRLKNLTWRLTSQCSCFVPPCNKFVVTLLCPYRKIRPKWEYQIKQNKKKLIITYIETEIHTLTSKNILDVFSTKE